MFEEGKAEARGQRGTRRRRSMQCHISLARLIRTVRSSGWKNTRPMDLVLMRKGYVGDLSGCRGLSSEGPCGRSFYDGKRKEWKMVSKGKVKGKQAHQGASQLVHDETRKTRYMGRRPCVIHCRLRFPG